MDPYCQYNKMFLVDGYSILHIDILCIDIVHFSVLKMLQMHCLSNSNPGKLVFVVF